MRFSAYLTFISLWSLLVYAPVAHWVWGGGWLADMGALDFAGGTVVHVNAAVARSGGAIAVGKRTEYPSASLVPHNVPFVLLGSGLLWFGWFGFNAGSALAASPIAGLAFVTTMLAPAGTLVVWTVLDVMRNGKPTAVGAATAIVVGLVAVTPAAGFISPMNAMILGGVRGRSELLGPGASRQDVARRLAGRGRRARRRRNRRRAADRRIRAEGLNGLADGRCTAIPASCWCRPRRSLPAIVYSGVVSFILLKLIGLVIPLRAIRDRRVRRSRYHTARRRGVPQRRRWEPSVRGEGARGRFSTDVQACAGRRVTAARH